MQVKNFIKHIIEPRTLSLVWQSPEGDGYTRFIVATLYNNQNQIDLKYLKESNDFIKAKELGFQGYSVFGLESENNKNVDVSHSFFRRLPESKREDFNEYLERMVHMTSPFCIFT